MGNAEVLEMMSLLGSHTNHTHPAIVSNTRFNLHAVFPSTNPDYSNFSLPTDFFNS